MMQSICNAGLLVWGYSVDFVDNAGKNAWSNVMERIRKKQHPNENGHGALDGQAE